MASTSDGLVSVVSVHGVGASLTDSLIQAPNASSGIELASIGATAVAAIPMPGPLYPLSILSSAAAAILVGVKIEEVNLGQTSLGDLLWTRSAERAGSGAIRES